MKSFKTVIIFSLLFSVVAKALTLDLELRVDDAGLNSFSNMTGVEKDQLRFSLYCPFLLDNEEKEVTLTEAAPCTIQHDSGARTECKTYRTQWRVDNIDQFIDDSIEMAKVSIAPIPLGLTVQNLEGSLRCGLFSLAFIPTTGKFECHMESPIIFQHKKTKQSLVITGSLSKETPAVKKMTELKDVIVPLLIDCAGN